MLFIVFLRLFQFQGSPCLLKPIPSHSIASIVGTIVFFEDIDIQMYEKRFPQARGEAVKMQPEASSVVHLLSSIYRLAQVTDKN